MVHTMFNENTDFQCDQLYVQNYYMYIDRSIISEHLMYDTQQPIFALNHRTSTKMMLMSLQCLQCDLCTVWDQLISAAPCRISASKTDEFENVSSQQFGMWIDKKPPLFICMYRSISLVNSHYHLRHFQSVHIQSAMFNVRTMTIGKKKRRC